MLLFPNAKINIGLNVTARRPDGYHDVETVMYPIGWTDILEVTPAPTTSLTVTGRGVACEPEKNLVIKALRAFESHTGIRAGVDIRLHKVIPDGAGLGGGSADAAFMLMALDRLHGTCLSDSDKAAIAAEIGADCPFFIYNRPMMATGTGTTLEPADLTLRGYLLGVVKPGSSVSTAVAYSGITPKHPEILLGDALRRPVTEWAGKVRNQFEESVFPHCPEAAAVKRSLEEMAPAYCSMSGSGSAVYALFDGDRMTAEELRNQLTERFAGMDVHTEHIEK